VLLGLVDADYQFIAVDVGAYGRNSDGFLANSNVGKDLKNNSLHLPHDKTTWTSGKEKPHVVIGDEAFPLSRHLMRPHSADQVSDDEEKKTFSYRLSRARNASENCFGILVLKFRIFER
jgi:hypothetical protein